MFYGTAKSGLTADLSSVLAGTFYGDHIGREEDVLGAQVDQDGSVWFTGTCIRGIPTTLGSLLPEYPGGTNGFVAHLSRDLAADPPCPRNGDVDVDGRITAADAQHAWAFALGLARPSFTERCAADCNADGRITAGDAQGVHAASLGAGSCADALPAQ